jgi:hypothetical protein
MDFLIKDFKNDYHPKKRARDKMGVNGKNLVFTGAPSPA